MGRYDSSKTRVAPVFDFLWNTGRDWLPKLLMLPTHGSPEANIRPGNLTVLERYWEPHEKCLEPPVSLLSWLIRNPGAMKPGPSDIQDRKLLATGDPETVERAIRLLRTEGSSRSWYIFEGPTYPDVCLVSRDALVVIEGKRTEAAPTIETKWLAGRHQIWRHLDAAWEIRGRRAVYGFFIVESDPPTSSVPEVWRQASMNCLLPEVLSSSFPHRSSAEIRDISRCFLGITTWRQVCETFQLDWEALPNETPR